MTKLVFCNICGECLGQNKPNFAKNHLKKYPEHREFLTKTIVDPFLVGTIDEWINRKLTSRRSTVDYTEPQNNNVIKY